jgi:hypothetical protein
VYPQSELNSLAARKVALRREIASSRDQCAAVAIRVLEPLAWLDRLLALGQALRSVGTLLFPSPRPTPGRNELAATPHE